jgi:hypothetical protein
VTVETQLILDRIDATERGINRRMDELSKDVRDFGSTAHTALLDAATARITADEAKLKVGQVHAAQKITDTQVTALVAAEAVLAKHYGRTLRWRDALLVVGTVGGLYSIAHTFGWIHF